MKEQLSPRRLDYSDYRAFGHRPFTAFALGYPRLFLFILATIVFCGALAGAYL